MGGKEEAAQVLAAKGLAVEPFRAANCGFVTDWSEPFRRRFDEALNLPQIAG